VNRVARSSRRMLPAVAGIGPLRAACAMDHEGVVAVMDVARRRGMVWEHPGEIR
jgi:hypothetical protein